MTFDPNTGPVTDLEWAEILLERRKVAMTSQLGAQVLHDMKVSSVMEHMFDRMLIKLQTDLYTHKVDTQDVRVPFSRTETVTTPGPRWIVGAFGPLVLAITALALALGSLSMFLVACVTTLAAIVVYVANPPHEQTVTAEGEVIVRREQFNSFPDNSIVYPKELGGAVRIASITSYPEYR